MTGSEKASTDARLYGPERKGVRPSLQHNALHMAKYAGEFAMIAEDADHDNPAKRTRAIERAQEWLTRNREADLLEHLKFIVEDLRDLAREPQP